MKTISTLVLSLTLISFSFAQSPRNALIEEFTNASCGPCAEQNPGFDELVDVNMDKIVVIKYQAPYPGYDPMYAHNPGDVDNRMSYYPEVDGVPMALLDGNLIDIGYPGFNPQYYPGAPGAFSQPTLDYAASITSPFDLDLDYTLSDGQITITAGATCTEATSGNLKFHVVVIERIIDFATAPGTNGETHFQNVMKKMLPVADGEAMNSAYQVGDDFTTQQTWELENVYNLDQIAVVVYVQNDDNKEVLQARELYKGYYDLDAEAVKVSGLPTYTCEPTVSPSVIIRNFGIQELTSADIDYVLNDVSGTINWTGSLAFYETAEVSLGEITFTPDGNNIIEVTISNPNNGEDGEDAISTNNVASTKVNLAGDATLDITVEIHTDYYPGDTSWEIRNSNDEIIASAQYTGSPNGGGANANTVKSHEVMLDPFDCHQFILYDEYGDGMQYALSDSELLGYRFIDGNGNVILEELHPFFNFGSEKHAGLITTDLLKVDDSIALTSLEMYPNPTSSNVNIAFTLTEPDHIVIDVVNILGQVVQSSDLGTLSSGYTLKKLDVSSLPSGLYLVNIKNKDAQVVRKLTITE